jgi:lambda family phage portal protein
MAERSWLDRALGAVAPGLHLKRVRARVAADIVLRHYEGAASGRRTQGWNRASGDANAVQGGTTLASLRAAARDLVRNNPYAESAIATIADHTVGWGIVAKPVKPHPRAAALWQAWAETTACDADGRHDLYGLQKLVLNCVVESGEVLVRRRMRRLADGFPIPMQLQVLEPDFIDTSRTGALPNGGQIIQGVEFDALGKRVAYWLYPIAPGLECRSAARRCCRRRAGFRPTRFGTSSRRSVRARCARSPGSRRVLLRFKDFDEFEDATLMKQKIAACLAVITSDIDGTAAPLGTADDTTTTPGVDSLEPGAILNVAPGRSVEVVQPPSVRDYGDYCGVTLRAIATGLGVSYEDLTGDYTNLPFSAARMSRLRHQARVIDWQWRLMIPQFCDPVWAWAMQAAAIMGVEMRRRRGGRRRRCR